jgi:hypothetical protein
MRTLILGLVVIVYLSSCSTDDPILSNTPGSSGSPINNPVGSSNQTTDWLIPKNEVYDGGPGKDGIPALQKPENISVSEGTYLTGQELVLGYFDGQNAMAYPLQILDWHEIVNDELNSFPYAITYCPLTGTGVGWDRRLNGKATTFGVSGLIYNNNLIPYDRETDSNWSQIRLDCVNGALINTKIVTFQIVETSWSNWKLMYPNTRVLSLNTGYNRSYWKYPYGDYKTNENSLLFPLSPDDRRLNRKERVHGIIIEGEAKVYRFGSFSSANTLINDVVNGKEVIVVGSSNKNFIVSFYSQLDDGTTPVFSAVDEGNVVLEDDLGNRWDIFGYAVSGPSSGSQLNKTESFMGYWFSWGAFYPGAEIHDL